MQKKLPKKISKILFFTIWCGLTACENAQLIIYPQYPVIQDAQVAGKTGVVASVASVPGREIIAVTNGQSRPPNMTQSVGGTTSSSLKVEGGIGFQKRLQFTVGLSNLYATNTSLNALYQVFGPTVSDKNADEKWTGSIYGSAGDITGSLSGNQTVIFGPGGYPWNAKARIRQYTIGSSVGYLLQKDLLFYAGLVHSSYTLNTSVEQSASATGDSAGGNYSSSSQGWATAPGIGFRYGRRFGIFGSAQSVTANWFGVGIETIPIYSIGVSFREISADEPPKPIEDRST